MASHDSPISVSGETMLSEPEKRLLATMPLHAITVVHGEDGLRERLLIETLRFPDEQRVRIDAALVLMSRLHEQDRRQRESYACHPLRVTIRILSHYRVADPDVACAALLHDTVEDHYRDIAPEPSRSAQPRGATAPPTPSWPSSKASDYANTHRPLTATTRNFTRTSA